MCAEERLHLAVDHIHYFSHWITPVGAPRRYDTRFFVAAAPPEQVPLHDDRETIANLWIRPADALERHRAGEFDLIFPTIKSLETIARFERSADLLAGGRRHRGRADHPAAHLGDDGHGVRILLPGDAGYDEAVPPAERLRARRCRAVRVSRAMD